MSDAASWSDGSIAGVSASSRHGFSKTPLKSIRLIAGFGVEGDAHAGVTTQHRYLVRKDPARRNLTQVHLLHAELFAELAEAGFEIGAGAMGENITTLGIDLLALPVGTLLHLGPDAIVEVTGLRQPCAQLDRLRAGLMKALLFRDAAGKVVRKAGIMGVVLAGGEVKSDQLIHLELPCKPWTALGPV